QARQIQERFHSLEIQHQEYHQARERLKILPMIEQEEKMIQAQHRKEVLQKSLEAITSNLQQQEEFLNHITQQGKEALKEVQVLEENLSHQRIQREDLLKINNTEQMLLLEDQIRQYLAVQEDSSLLNQKSELIRRNLIEKDKIKARLSELRQKEELSRDLQGVASKHLHEGEPCPLCGSLEHPNPYLVSDDRDLLELSDQVQKLQKDVLQLEHEENLLLEYQATLIENKHRMQEILGIYTNYEDLEQACQQSRQDKIRQDKELEDLKRAIDFLQEKYTATTRKVQELKEQHQESLREKDRLEREKEYQNHEFVKLEEELLVLDQEEYDKYEIIKTYPQKTSEDVEE
ncbi:MAG: hypothetical protein ACRC0X_03355, partial [Brevinema sp.]